MPVPLLKQYLTKAAVACLLSFGTVAPTFAQFVPSPDFSNAVLISFVQDAPNCASEAVAKTMIATYGLTVKNGVFVDQVTEATGIAVTLRNGETVHISNLQLDAAKRNSAFTLSDGSQASQNILNLSNLIYAVIAVRAVDHGQGPLADLGSLDAVFARLHKGVDADYLFEALGYLIDDSRIGPDAPVAFLFGNAVHAVFATAGNFDQYGTSIPLDLFLKKHPARGPVWKYTVVQSEVRVQQPVVTLACKYKNGTWIPGKSCD